MTRKRPAVKPDDSKPSRAKPNLRGRLKSDFPKHTLDEALKVAQALADKNGGEPLPPPETAIAMNMSPGSSEFRILLSSSIKYGLTSGSFNSERVALEEIGRNIVEPRTKEDQKGAMAAAALTPRTFKAIYEYFKGKKLPEGVFFQNTIAREFDVPREHAAKCLAVFSGNMEALGFVNVASTGKWLSSAAATPLKAVNGPERGELGGEKDDAADDKPAEAVASKEILSGEAPVFSAGSNARLRRVFITHGKNTAFISPIKDLLSFGQLEPIVSVERESVAQPVPDKVLNDMRTCGAAIIHIEDEVKLMDQAAKEHVLLNSNVLIEIGAAMALYGRRYIFLVKEGVALPSNIQGLYEVRYSGDKLDGEVTIRLLKAINEMKKQPLPGAAKPQSETAANGSLV